MKKLLFGLATVATVGLSALNAGSAPAPYHVMAYEVATNSGHEYVYNKKLTTYDHAGTGGSSLCMVTHIMPHLK